MTRYIIILLSLVIGGGVFFFYTKPTYDEIQSLQAKDAQYEAALTKAAELQTIKQSLLSKYNAIDPNNLDRLQKLLPDHVDNVRLILDLDNLATRYGLALENVDVSSAEASNAVQTPTSVIGGGNKKYESLTLKFRTRGTYATFEQFLDALETSLRIVDLTNLTITPDSAPTANGMLSTEPSYSYSIVLKTYWLK